MLHEFLTSHRDAILLSWTKRLEVLNGTNSLSDEMGKGLPLFYDELVEVLKIDEEQVPDPEDDIARRIHL